MVRFCKYRDKQITPIDRVSTRKVETQVIGIFCEVPQKYQYSYHGQDVEKTRGVKFCNWFSFALLNYFVYKCLFFFSQDNFIQRQVWIGDVPFKLTEIF